MHPGIFAGPFRAAASLGVLLTIGGCVADRPSPASPANPVSTAVTQPFRDLSLIRDKLPPAIVEAAVSPYRPLEDCRSIARALSKLDEVLGRDVDAPLVDGDSAELAGDIITSAASLPFRGVIRRVSGAQERDRAAAAAVLAAMARRGFLKGERAALHCETSSQKD